MKAFLTLIVTIGALFALTPEAEARNYGQCGHNQQTYRYVSGHTSCGCPIYTVRWISHYDCYGRPVYSYRTEPAAHRCNSRVNHGHNHHPHFNRQGPPRYNQGCGTGGRTWSRWGNGYVWRR